MNVKKPKYKKVNFINNKVFSDSTLKDVISSMNTDGMSFGE